MNNSKLIPYRCCFLPMWKNTTKSAPSKVFVSVPSNESRRKLWFRLARRLDVPTNSNYYCCEDHFVLKDDMENYVRFCMMGGPIKMKLEAVPHIFSCQPQRTRTAPLQSRTASVKRRRKADIADILASAGCSSAPDYTEKENTTPNIPARSVPTIYHAEDESRNYDDSSNVCLDSEITCLKSIQHRGTQINLRPHVRSKGVSCNIPISASDAACSPIKLEYPSIKNTQIRANDPGNSPQSSEGFLSSSVSLLATFSSDYEPYSEEVEEIEKIEKKRMQYNALKMTSYFISINTKSYLGIQNEFYCIIDMLHSQTRIPADHIKLTLMKIKVDDKFERVGEQFGVSPMQASKIFSSTVPRLAHMLKILIYFTSPVIVRKSLPIPFRPNYSHVQSIIDCFEIEIQKPTDSVHQALTWSEYKKTNTLMYLVSVSPDGLVNFISKGYGGRISDTLITDQSGFVDLLPEGCGVMADRGFRQIQTLLNKKKCSLIRPPTVLSNVKPSKAEVLETKRIANLRIHIERAIRRLREYNMLKPHACIHHNLIP